MYNHVRTLLLNAPATQKRDRRFPGEEPAPADFVPVQLPGDLLAVRRVLFGSAPDRAYLNWRLRQYLTLIHQSPLADHVTSYDPRVTYWPFARSIDDGCTPAFGSTAATVSGAQALQLAGTPEPDDAHGRLVWEGSVALDGSRVAVTQITPTLAEAEATAAAGTPFELPGTPVRGVLSPGAGSWTVTLLARPGRDLAAVIDGLRSLLGTGLGGRLFGTAAAEPDKTYYQLWRHGPAHLKVAAAVLALARRTEEHR